MKPFECSVSLGAGIPSVATVDEKFFKLVETAPSTDDRIWPQSRVSAYSPDGSTLLAVGARFTKDCLRRDEWLAASAALETKLSVSHVELIYWTGPLHGGSGMFSQSFLGVSQVYSRLFLALDFFVLVPLVRPIQTREFTVQQAHAALAARESVFLDSHPQGYSANERRFMWTLPIGSQSEPRVGFSQGERVDLLSELERSRDEARFNDLVSQWRSQKSAARKLREQAKLTENAFQELGAKHGFVVSKEAEQ